jgi:hypothetical protein
MKNKVLFTILLALLLLSACNSAPAGQEFNSDAGKFSVMVPVTLKEETTSVTLPQGGERQVHMFSGETKQLAYVVTYTDYGFATPIKDPQTLLNSVRDTGVAAPSGGILEKQSPLTLDGNQGIEYSVNYKDNNNVDSYSRTRVYIVGNRMYQLIVAGAKADASEASISAFLTSFKLLK